MSSRYAKSNHYHVLDLLIRNNSLGVNNRLLLLANHILVMDLLLDSDNGPVGEILVLEHCDAY